MRRQRWNKYYQKGWGDQSWDPPFNSWFDSDNDDTRAAREAYEQGWNDNQQLRGERKSSWGPWPWVLGALVLVAVIASPHRAESVSTGSGLSQQQCSWQWRYTDKWLPNYSWYREWYYTGYGFWGLDGRYHREWRYTGRNVPGFNGTWRREQKQFRICE